MYDHTMHRGRQHFSGACLQAFSTEEILKTKDMTNKRLSQTKTYNA